jgi:ribosome maturation factor RimP
MSDTTVLEQVRGLVAPIASDLQLDLYDVERRGGTLRVTLDTPPGSEGGVDLDQLALATRLISRELDHADPVPGKYTLEVTSPGLERSLRTPAHFRREIGKIVNLRLSDVDADQRRVQGELVAADDHTATVRVDVAGEPVDRVIALDSIDRARTVFEWGPQPKPGGKGAKHKQGAKNKQSAKNKQGAERQPSNASKQNKQQEESS